VRDQDPFADVVFTEQGFSIPELKWRELLFVGALREEQGAFVRDPSRPLPPFRIPNLFPEGVSFSASRRGARIHLERGGRGSPGGTEG
jgi:hypothetical protein